MANVIAVKKTGPGGIANMYALVLDATIDTYTTGGITLDVPSTYAKAVGFVTASRGFTGSIEDGKLKLYSAGVEASTLASAVQVSILLVV